MNYKSVSARASILVFWLLTFVVTTFAQDAAPKLDEYLSAITKQGRFSGAVLVARDGKMILSKGYGLANAELDVPNTPQTKFRRVPSPNSSLPQPFCCCKSAAS